MEKDWRIIMAKKNETPAQQTEVSVAAETTETPKTVETAKEIKTSPRERKYKLLTAPTLTPKGKQRQIVLEILKTAENPMTAAEVAKLAKPMGLSAAAGVEASVAWHLHQMAILKIAEVVNPTSAVESAPPATEEEVAEAQTMVEVSGD
jgi:hypothetical protein